jgi:hypothetical protein
MKSKHMRDELNNETAKAVAYGSRKNEIEDLTFSENDIQIHEHCNTGQGWSHAVGYLMYAMEFPTRILLDDLINAMEIVFPDHTGKEWGAFQSFRDNVKNFLQHIDRLDPASQDQLIDKLYYDFSKKIKVWLESGISEPTREEDLPVAPVVQSGIDVEKVATWTRKQRQTKDVQKAAERISRRKNKDDFIAEPRRVTQRDPIYRKIRPGYYRKIRKCPVCEGVIIEAYKRFCSIECQDQDALNKNPDLVEKYFPKTKR